MEENKLDRINIEKQSKSIHDSKNHARDSEDTQRKSSMKDAKWINNDGEEVINVFGFNENAELVNGRTAMIGFILLVITEIIFKGDPVTKSIFGIG